MAPPARRFLDMHEIIPRLYLGSIRAAADRCAMEELGITHVLSVCCAEGNMGHRQRVRMPPSEENPCTRMVIAVQDVASARLDRHFEACSSFISEGLAEGAVLVHCQAGQSRSPTVVIAHLMREKRWTAASALRFVQKKRASVHPNPGFMDQLRALESRLGIKETDVVAVAEECLASQLTAVGFLAEENDAEIGEDETSAVVDALDSVDVQVDVPDDLFGAAETRLRCERFRSRCHRLRSATSLIGVAAPLRKRRYL